MLVVLLPLLRFLLVTVQDSLCQCTQCQCRIRVEDVLCASGVIGPSRAPVQRADAPRFWQLSDIDIALLDKRRAWGRGCERELKEEKAKRHQ